MLARPWTRVVLSRSPFWWGYSSARVRTSDIGRCPITVSPHVNGRWDGRRTQGRRLTARAPRHLRPRPASVRQTPGGRRCRGGRRRHVGRGRATRSGEERCGRLYRRSVRTAELVVDRRLPGAVGQGVPGCGESTRLQERGARRQVRRRSAVESVQSATDSEDHCHLRRAQRSRGASDPGARRQRQRRAVPGGLELTGLVHPVAQRRPGRQVQHLPHARRVRSRRQGGRRAGQADWRRGHHRQGRRVLPVHRRVRGATPTGGLPHAEEVPEDQVRQRTPCQVRRGSVAAGRLVAAGPLSRHRGHRRRQRRCRDRRDRGYRGSGQRSPARTSS
jgi:hypothetical protein